MAVPAAASEGAGDLPANWDGTCTGLRGGQQWVYSFKHNAWGPLALDTDAEMGFSSPYAQVAYSAKYGVPVNVGAQSHGTTVMRPDFSKIQFY